MPEECQTCNGTGIVDHEPTIHDQFYDYIPSDEICCPDCQGDGFIILD